MNIGAGTVINEEQAIRAVNARAKFIVSPGFSEKVALYVHKQGIPYYPGCVTPTEIMQALELGITTVKFFPQTFTADLKRSKRYPLRFHKSSLFRPVEWILLT